MGSIFTYQDPNSQPKDTATYHQRVATQANNRHARKGSGQSAGTHGRLRTPIGGLRGPRQRGERSSRGWLRVLACTQGAGRVAPWGRGACEGRIVARGRARDTRSRVDSDMRVRNEGQLVPCAIDFGATNRPERPLLGGMTRWREVRTMHSTSGRYNERGTRRSGSSPKVS